MTPNYQALDADALTTLAQHGNTQAVKGEGFHVVTSASCLEAPVRLPCLTETCLDKAKSAFFTIAGVATVIQQHAALAKTQSASPVEPAD